MTNFEILSNISAKYPQSAYTVLTYSFQAEWQCLCRVMPPALKVLSTVEAAICSKFLPALQGDESINDTTDYFSATGIGIRDPTSTADVLYSSLFSEWNLFVNAMLQNSQLDVIECKKM